MQNFVFGGAAFVLSGTLRASQAANLSTAPLAISPMPQPNADIIWSVAFSSPSQRMAVSAGPDEDLTSLYVNSPAALENFQVYWAPDTEVHGIVSLAWSHNEDALAFIGMSGSRTTKTAEVWLYVLDVASGEIRNVLKIGEAIQGKERRLVNVHEERAVLTWFGENKICMNTIDNSIIAVDRNDGHIETLVPAQDHKIMGPASVSNKLRFLKKRPSLSGNGWDIEVCDFNGSEVIKHGIPISSEKTFSEGLSGDGKYVFIIMPDMEEPGHGKTSIFDVSQKTLVKEIPLVVKRNSKTYGYAPVTVLKGEKVVLFEVEMNKSSLRRRLCTVKL